MSRLTVTPVKDLPTIPMLRRLFNYNPGTGALSWKIQRSNRIKVGDPVGTKTTNGYFQVTIKTKYRKVRIGVSRIIWTMMTNRWPRNIVDHADGNKINNKWINLREASRAQNMANSKRKANNKTGYKGVVFCRNTKRWRARIMQNRRVIDLGRHDSPEAAYKAYCAATRRLNGTYARTE